MKQSTIKTVKNLVCDYLVVGAGASPLAFIDTLLTEIPSAKVIVIDKKAAPGGHWVDSYGFVRLHQPSLLYGVASKQLEGNWLKLMATKFTLPWKHRASKQEILTYFNEFINEKIAAGQLEFYPNSIYNFEGRNADGIHTFSSIDGTMDYKVKVNVKLVDGTAGECIIPCQSPLQFPVDDGVRVMTPNQLYNAHTDGQVSKHSGNKFVVLGAGKTAMDSVVYLQRKMKIAPDDIAWVIPNDVWMLRLEGSGDPWAWPKALLQFNGDVDKASNYLEEKGGLTRLDKNIQPTKFRFPVIPKDELKLLRNVKNVIRRGRAVAIRKNGDNVQVKFGTENPVWDAFAPADKCVFIHATSPGPFNGRNVDDLFVNEQSMTLNLLTAPPISSSMSTIAKVEAARRKGTLDLDFVQNLMLASEAAPESKIDTKYTENDIIRWAIRGYKLSAGDQKESVKPIVTLGMVFAILNKDPMVAYEWMKTNRLTFLSIPGFKCRIYEDTILLCEKGKGLGFSDNDIRVFEILAEKLKPLEGL